MVYVKTAPGAPPVIVPDTPDSQLWSNAATPAAHSSHTSAAHVAADVKRSSGGGGPPPSSPRLRRRRQPAIPFRISVHAGGGVGGAGRGGAAGSRGGQGRRCGTEVQRLDRWVVVVAAGDEVAAVPRRRQQPVQRVRTVAGRRGQCQHQRPDTNVSDDGHDNDERVSASTQQSAKVWNSGGVTSANSAAGAQVAAAW